METKYIFFYIEVALKKRKDLRIYAFINVSHIPTKILIEIFKIDIAKDPEIVEGYLLKRKQYKKFKKYIHENIGQINLDIFQYSVQQYTSSDESALRKLYKKDLME